MLLLPLAWRCGNVAKPLALNPDPERPLVLLLRSLVSQHGIGALVTDDVPPNWRPGSTPHLTVYSDGAAASRPGIVAYPTMRLVARAGTAAAPATLNKQAASELARRAEALLLAYTGGPDFASFRSLLGVQPAQDPETGHELAWFTVRAAARTVPF